MKQILMLTAFLAAYSRTFAYYPKNAFNTKKDNAFYVDSARRPYDKIVKVRKVIIAGRKEKPVSDWWRCRLKDLPLIERHGDTLLQVKF